MQRCWTVEESDSTFVSDNIHLSLDGTFIGPCGKTVSFVVNLQIKDAASPDRSTTVSIRGIQGRVTIPGQGKIAATIGRLELVFPADGGEPTVEFHGQDSGEAFFGSPGSPGILCTMLV